MPIFVFGIAADGEDYGAGPIEPESPAHEGKVFLRDGAIAKLFGEHFVSVGE